MAEISDDLPSATRTLDPAGAAPRAAAAAAGEDAAGAFLRYDLGEELGHGGEGRVLRAWDRELAREVVVKLPLRPEGHRRLAREALLTAGLEHPGIVAVHAAGRLADGTPFYVMKHVAGRSLRDAIRTVATLEERLALLPAMLAVCDAVAYAHARGVIHRDLKPHNVLLGAFGETTVVDWGMARRLDEPEPEGTILGTPAYMAPEQARGEPVDARADVYGLGAMLYMLLAGEAPYQGSSGHEVVRAVTAGPPPPLAERVPRLPSELAAIVQQAMAREPQARYPSARELAEDLRRYQTGKLVAAHSYSAGEMVRRWLRRYRAPLAVAAVAAALLVVVGIAAVRRVVREKERATGERAAAEELVDFMLNDLRGRMRRVGKLALLDGIAGQVDAYYRRVTPPPEGSRRQAQAYQILAQIRESQGNVAEALRAEKEHVAIARRRAAALPADGARGVELAAALDEEAKMEVQSGAYARGREGFTAALAALPAGGPGVDRARGRILARVADLDAFEGHGDASLAGFQRAIPLLEAVLAARPDDTELAEELVYDDGRLAKQLAQHGETPDALARAAAGEALARNLAARMPDDTEWQSRLALAISSVADCLHELGRDADAAARHREGLAIQRALVARDPDNRRWQSLLAKEAALLGEVLVTAGALEDARAPLAEAEALLERLVAHEPQKTPWVHQLWFTLMLAGEADHDAHPADALRAYRRSLELAERMVARQKNPHLEANLATSLYRVGETSLLLGRRDEARPPLERALEIYERHLRERPAGETDRNTLAAIHEALADAGGDREAVLGHLRQATVHGDAGLAGLPPLSPAGADVARYHARLAALVGDGGAEGQASLRRARELLRALEAGGRLPPAARPAIADVEARLARSGR